MFVLGAAAFAGVMAILFIAYLIYRDAKEEKRNQEFLDQLLIWPDQYYQPFCEQCGLPIEKRWSVADTHFSPTTGQSDMKRIKLFWICPLWSKDKFDYSMKYRRYMSPAHYYEAVDEYELVRSGVNKWKRKNVEEEQSGHTEIIQRAEDIVSQANESIRNRTR